MALTLNPARPTRTKPQTHIQQPDRKMRLSVDLEPEMMAALKVRAAQDRTTIREIVIRLIGDELGR